MKRFWQWMATALLVAIFLSLANWQWNRAADLKRPLQIDQTILPLDSVISPTQAVRDEHIGRRVSVEGKFVSFWKVPNQKASPSGERTWDVGLLQTKDNAMILVVRGYQKSEPGVTGAVKVTGILLPPQSKSVFEDKSQVGDQLSRVDSSLFVSKTKLPLYAPYINAISEEPNSGYEVVKVELRKNVPGFYWQHISYVVIWVLFAFTAIYLMLYQRKLGSGKVAP